MRWSPEKLLIRSPPCGWHAPFLFLVGGTQGGEVSGPGDLGIQSRSVIEDVTLCGKFTQVILHGVVSPEGTAQAYSC